MNFNKVKKTFVNLQTNQVEIYCLPEVFALGCFHVPTIFELDKLNDFLRRELGTKFSNYSVEARIAQICLKWYLPKIDYQEGKIIAVTNKFWKNTGAGTMAHKLPTIRNKDLIQNLGLSKNVATDKIKSLKSTKIIKAYIDEAKEVNPLYTKIRYIQLNVPLMLSILYTKDDIKVALTLLQQNPSRNKFTTDVEVLMKKALAF